MKLLLIFLSIQFSIFSNQGQFGTIELGAENVQLHQKPPFYWFLCKENISQLDKLTNLGRYDSYSTNIARTVTKQKKQPDLIGDHQAKATSVTDSQV